MKKTPVVFTSILLLIGTVFGAATLFMPAHASSAGVVCIIPNGASSCPSTPASITGHTGSQVRVPVFIQNSSGINGFDITLLADHNVLRPSSYDLTGSVLFSPQSIVDFCFGGVLGQGNLCPPTDNIDTLHLAAVSTIGSPLTSTPTTGLLFTAIYNVTGTTSGIALRFQTGCTGTSVGGGACVTLTNGTPTPVPETVQTATFSTSTTPDFVMAVSASSLSINPGQTATSTLIVTGVNGFSGTVLLAATISSTSLSISLNPASITLAANQTAASTITVSTTTSTPSGTYSLTISGMSGSLSHSVTISVLVNAADFSISASPGSISVVQGSSASSTISLGSINGFTGTVSLTAFRSSSSLTTNLTPTSITLTGGGAGASTLTISTTSTTPTGIYTVAVTASSGSTSHTTTLSVTVASSSSADFAITDSATFLAIPVASERQTVVTLTSLNGFSGYVGLVAKPSSTAFACWFTTLTNTSTVFVPPGGSANEYPTCGAGRPAGSYSLTITGTSSSLVRAVTLRVNITDFGMSGPSSVSFNSGSSTAEAITFSSLSGFSGIITLNATSPPAVSASCPANVTLGPGGTATVICSLASSTPGSYSVSFTGTFICRDCYYDGKDINSLTTIVNVFNTGTPDFSISANPSSIRIVQGSSGTSTITVTAFNGFSGLVSLKATPSPGIGAIISQTSVTGSGTATLTIGTNSTGTFSVQVVGTSGSLSHSTTVTVAVSSGATPDFSLSASPSSITIPLGSSETSTITVSALNGFSGVVSLTSTVSSGIIATISPASVTGSGTVSLTVTGSLSGAFSVQITGVSGSIAHSIIIPVTVTTVGVVCTAQSGATSCPVGPASLTGTVGTQLRVSVFIQGSLGLGGFDVTLLADHTILRPAGVDLTGTLLVGTPTILVECLSGVLVRGSTCSSTDTIDTLQLAAVSAPGSGLTATPTTGLLFTAIYNITGTTSGTSLGFQTGCTNTSVSGGACVTVANGSAVSDPETVQSATFSNSISQPDFSISANPSTLILGCNGSATSSVTLSSINSFNGTVILTLKIVPIGISASISSTSVTLTAGGSGTSTLTASLNSGPAGTYQVTVTGTSGVLTHSTVVLVTVTLSPCFSMTASPTSMTLTAGQTATSTITVAAFNGFTGTIALSATSPAVLTASLNPTSVVLSGGTATSILTISTTSSTLQGSYTVTVTGTSGTATQSLTVSVTVVGVSPPDFSLSASPIAITTSAGALGSSFITVAPVNGFAGTVTLTSSVSPAGLTCTLNVTSVVLGPSQTSFLLCGGSAGNYTVTVTGTSGSLSHAVTVVFFVTDFTMTSSPSTITILAGATATSTVAIMAVNGFTGTITLSASSSPGLTVTVSPASVLVNGGSATAILTISSTSSTPSGSYTVTVKGFSGAPAHTTTVSVTVTGTPDFTINATPTNQTMARGASATFTITIKGINGFNRTISLSTTIFPVVKNGPKISAPTTVGPYSNSTLAVSTGHPTPIGTYTITVTATSGSITHKVTITVIVTR